ncbi:YdeI/OmpD-associated family protein [candidate division KSB1 bacterium]
MTKSGKTHRFSARLYKVGINRCVDVPEDIADSLGRGKYIPVIGNAEGLEIRTTLVPRGKGKYRLFIHSSVWRILGIDEGDPITVYIEKDTESRELPLPQDIASAFPEDSIQYSALKSLTATHRSGFIKWVEEAKTPETREIRIQVGIDRILETYYKRRKK